MNRRGFLSLLASAAGVALADPEALLWTPGAKLISIPKAPPLPPLLSIGDVFTIWGRYQVNPVTRKVAIYTDPTTGKRYKFLQRFTVTSEVPTFDLAAMQTATFPPIIERGLYTNVTCTPFAYPRIDVNGPLVVPIS